ncbi:hypothetical protein BpHYR1_016944 [Brachionus plicatilis]|uniref:Uncharacterized protein n=1 Tax=Brachionus plicatilis TaxID=10195 RepID=A0A3M7SS02_BRAPC|nr:hypothetical protein BpHYR1_016944 [Brachionus plicatilis]
MTNLNEIPHLVVLIARSSLLSIFNSFLEPPLNTVVQKLGPLAALFSKNSYLGQVIVSRRQEPHGLFKK